MHVWAVLTENNMHWHILKCPCFVSRCSPVLHVCKNNLKVLIYLRPSLDLIYSETTPQCHCIRRSSLNYVVESVGCMQCTFFLWGVCAVCKGFQSRNSFLFCIESCTRASVWPGRDGTAPVPSHTHLSQQPWAMLWLSKVLLLHRRDHSGTQETCLKNEQPHAGMLLNTKSQDQESFWESRLRSFGQC